MPMSEKESHNLEFQVFFRSVGAEAPCRRAPEWTLSPPVEIYLFIAPEGAESSGSGSTPVCHPGVRIQVLNLRKKSLASR